MFLYKKTERPPTQPFSRPLFFFLPKNSLPHRTDHSLPAKMMQQQPAPPPFPTIRERCVGCRTFLHAAPGVSELPCPQCQMPHAFAGAVDPSAVRLRCPTCKALVNAPSDLSRFPCPQCGVELDVHADGDGVNEVFILRLFFR